MAVSGSASGARTLWTDVGRCIGRIMRSTEEVEGKLQALGSSFKDEDYQEFAGAIETVNKKTQEMLKDVLQIKPELEHYASVLERAKMN